MSSNVTAGKAYHAFLEALSPLAYKVNQHLYLQTHWILTEWKGIEAAEDV